MFQSKKRQKNEKRNSIFKLPPELQASPYIKFRIIFHLFYSVLMIALLSLSLFFSFFGARDLFTLIIFSCFIGVSIIFEIMLLRKNLFNKSKPPKNLAELRRHLHHKSWAWERRVFGILPVLTALPKEKRWWNEYLDFIDLRTFDQKIKHGDTASIPLLRSELGRQYLQWYIKFYREEHGIDLPSETWVCTCGRENPGYILTCVCGAEQKTVCPASDPKTWHCSCGRENPHYTSTCVCGKNKREEKS